MPYIAVAFPLQDGTDSFSAKIPSLNEPISGPGSPFFGHSVANSKPPQVLAFNSEANTRSNSKIDPGILKPANSDNDNVVFGLSHLDSSLSLDKPISSVPLDPDSFDPFSNLATPNVQSSNAENSVVADVPQKAENHGQYNEWKLAAANPAVSVTEFEANCGAHRKPRIHVFCCLGKRTSYGPFVDLYTQSTNQGGCFDGSRDGGRCSEDIEKWFCCFSRGVWMEVGFEGISCVPAAWH